MILVSACLLGENCKYNGGNNFDSRIKKLLESEEIIPICPEVLGGCPTPRETAEICGGTGAEVLDGICKVKTKSSEDVTDKFITGAKEVLAIAKAQDVKKAVLKANSPSCGCGKIYNGSFCSELIGGNGVTAELLKRNGISVFTEKNYYTEE